MRKVINFNRKWAFAKALDEVPTAVDERFCLVNLPHTWNNIDGQDGDNDYYRGRCFYVKEIEAANLLEADMYYLEICGANSSASVYVNGKLLKSHDGGYSTWRVDMTEALMDDKKELHAKSLVVISVDNSANDKVYPQMADFTFYGGLYRDVNIICVSHSHFDLDYYGSPGIKVTPKIEGCDARIELESYLSNICEGQEISYTIYDGEGRVVTNTHANVFATRAELLIKDVHLWQGRKNPYLYKAEAVLLDKGEEIDRVCAEFGCRTFEIDPEKGFILNGECYPLRGVSRHQDWWEIGNALLKEHHDRDMELIMEMGVTTIRLAHYQHDQYFYDLCDKFGMIVWAEIPYISKHLPEGRDNTISQMKELVLQNYNHPSIVVWGLSNEITMAPKEDLEMIENHRILNEMVCEMDTTRLTTIACVSMCDINHPYIQIPDVVSYNHYFGWYGGDVSMNGPWFDKFHETFPNIPIGVSEYGCEALNWHSSKPVQGDYTEEYQAYYHEEMIKQLFTRQYLWATHVWNMFDFGADARNEGGENGQNHKGLVTFDRKYKKDSFYAYKAWLSDEPFVHICGKRYVDRVEEVTQVTVYSNQPEVELFVNGRSLGKQKNNLHFFYFKVPNEGESKLVAIAGKCRDESVIKKVEIFNEAYRMKEKGAILNWFDITQKEGCFSLNDKLGDILKSPEGKEVVLDLLGTISSDGNVAGFEMNDSMMKMMEGFTVIRLCGLLGMTGKNVSKEELLELNGQLNEIQKGV